MKATNVAKVISVAAVGTALVGVTAVVSFAGTQKAAAEGTRTTRVSVSYAGVQANGWSDVFDTPVVSNGGRFVAFASRATNLVPGDTNGQQDVFVRDTQAGSTTRVSIPYDEAHPGNDFGGSESPSISADGRYVAFVSWADSLVSGDTNSNRDVFVRDLEARTTTRVSVADDEAQAQGGSGWYGSSDASISPDGRHVTFVSDARNLVPGDTNAVADVFVRDLDARTTTRVNVASDGQQIRGKEICTYGCGPQLSSLGRYVIFASGASNLVPGDTNGQSDVFVHDVVAGTTTRVNVSTKSAQADGEKYSIGSFPRITSDGRYAFFTSSATNLVPDDTNDATDLFRRDLVTGTTTLIKGVGFDVGQISANGRYVGFESAEGASFVRDIVTGVDTQVSVSSAGTPGNGRSRAALLSPDGRAAVFASAATNLVEGDTNGVFDVFLHELGGA